MTDALEATCDFPELSDELSLPSALVLCGDRSRIIGSDVFASVVIQSPRRRLERSPSSVSVPSDSDTGEWGRFWDGTSVSIPGVSLSKARMGEDGRARVTGLTDPGGGKLVCPETTPANVRGLVGGVVDILTTLGAAGTTTGLVAFDRGRVG